MAAREAAAAKPGVESSPLDDDDEDDKLIRKSVKRPAKPPEEKPPVPPASVLMRKLEDKASSLVRHPTHKTVQRWNRIIAIVLLVEVPILPLQLAFIPEEDLGRWPWLLWFRIWTDLLFWLDNFLQFFLQIRSPDDSHYIQDFDQIVSAYVTGTCIPDFISVLPFKRVGLLEKALHLPMPNLTYEWDPACVVQVLTFHKMLRFVRIPRVMRSIKMHDARLGHHLQIRYHNQLLVVSLCAIFFSAHTMACIWSTMFVCSSTTYTWWQFKAEGKESSFFYEATNENVFLCAFYWAIFTLTGIGYGDVAPVTPMEYSMATLCMFLGSLTWAWVVANIVSIMATMNKKANAHAQTLDSINMLISESAVEPSLGRELREYFTKMRDIKGDEAVNELIDQLSPELQGQVVYAVHGPWIRQVWWLDLPKTCTEFVVEITQLMRASLHTPNELVPHRTDLCIIRQGLCIHGGTLLTKGRVFGIDMLLNNPELCHHYATLALTFLHILSLRKEVFETILQQHPEAQPAVRRNFVLFAIMRGMKLRAKHVKRAMRAHPDWDFDPIYDDLSDFHDHAGQDLGKINKDSASVDVAYLASLQSADKAEQDLMHAIDDAEARMKSRMEQLERATDRLIDQVTMLGMGHSID